MPGILIVDDNADIRCFLRELIASYDHLTVCGEAGNGSEAIERATALRPDLIVMDLSMPVMNGLAAAAILKKSMPHVKIALFTLNVHECPPERTQALGIDLVFSKSDNVCLFPAKLKQLLQS